VEEIDTLNIFQATLLAMQRAVSALSIVPDEALIDGLHCPALACTATAVVGGDASVAAISAASIIAKVTRDRIMLALHLDFPEYGFAQHKGYPTAAHVAALERCGASSVHRRSFAPVRRVLPGAGR
jgi:ribonuclease HII